MFGGFALALFVIGSLFVVLGMKGEGGDSKAAIILGSVICVIGLLICLCSCRCCQKPGTRIQALSRVVEEESTKYEVQNRQWRLKLKK